MASDVILLILVVASIKSHLIEKEKFTGINMFKKIGAKYIH